MIPLHGTPGPPPDESLPLYTGPREWPIPVELIPLRQGDRTVGWMWTDETAAKMVAAWNRHAAMKAACEACREAFRSPGDAEALQKARQLIDEAMQL